MNCKAQAGDWLMIFPFMLFCTILAITISIGLGAFFQSDYDFKKVDSTSLNQKVLDCLEKENLPENQEHIKDFLENTCKINQNKINEHFVLTIFVNNEIKYSAGSHDSSECNLDEISASSPACITSLLEKNSVNYKIISGSTQNSEEKLA